MKEKLEKLKDKKRLMFSKDEDYYFITYNLLILLNTIGCISQDSKFIDYTKLAYIIPFVSDTNLLNIILKYNELERYPSREEIEKLQETYLRSRIRIKLLTTIILALEHKGLITLRKNERRHCIDIWINKDKIPNSFLNSSLFKIEVENTLKFKSFISRLKSLSAKTLQENIFANKGVRLWDV